MAFPAKTVANLFPARQVFTKRRYEKLQSLDDRTLHCPAQIPVSCTCKWNYKWTVCEHTGVVTVASVFSGEYKVPDKLIAATPVLHEKRLAQSGVLPV